MRLGVVQLGSGPDRAANRAGVAEAVDGLLAEAGPLELVVLPEAVQRDLGDGSVPLAPDAEPLDGPFVTMLARLAQRHGTTLVAGLFEAAAAGAADGRPSNTVAVVGPDGALRAAYRKVHLYDAFGYRESDLLAPGPVAPCVVDVAGLPVGIMTCYDLRFPEQARALVDAGAALLLVPAAWVAGPGKVDHWTTLLRARAIENTVPVVGVGQPGPRYCGTSTVVDAAGAIVLQLGGEPASGVVTLDPATTATVRAANPSLLNRRWRVLPG
jgi:predicted amidohydrolase